MREDNNQKSLFTNINRRQFLASSAVGVCGVGMLSGTANAQQSTITISQGGTSFEVTPLNYEDQTIEQFYSYDNPDNASANTPTGLESSDTTRAFFYDGPRGLSLVVIHDQVQDGDGGEVRFDFDGLSAGRWVVQDDPGETSYDINAVTWEWAPCCTDGGALRGVSGQSFTLRPEFRSGIDTFEFLSGDPRNPDVQELSLSEPIQIEGDATQPGGELDVVAEQKLALAQRVADASLDVDDVRIAQQALDTLQDNVSAGDLSEADAVEAVQRLKLGENVSETALVATGPTDVITPEDNLTLVGADRSQSYNLIDRFTDLFVELCAIVAVLGGAIAGGVAAVLGGAAVAAVNELYAVIKSLLTVIGSIADTVAELFDSDTIDQFAEVVKTASSPENALASELLEPAKDTVRTDLRQTIEEEYTGSVEPVLTRFADTVSGELADSGDPTPGIGGTTEAARTNSERAVDTIVEKVSNEVSDLKTTRALTAVLDIAAGLAALGSFVFGITGAAAAILAGVSTLMKALQTVDTFSTITDIISIHAQGVDGVRRGEVILDA